MVGKKAPKLGIICSQPYLNITFAAGLVKNSPVEQVFLMIRKPREKPTIMYFQAHEALAVISVLSGTLWSERLLYDTDMVLASLDDKG